MADDFQRIHAWRSRWKAITRDMEGYVVGAILISVIASGMALSVAPVITMGGAIAAVIFIVLAAIGQVQMEYQRRGLLKPYRGRTIHLEYGARMEARRQRPKDDPGVLWGKVRIPTTDAMTHFLAVGGIGSGKTLTMQILMNDQFKHLTPGSDRRALIFDSKEDFVQIVAGIEPPCPLHILNPFDSRRTAWDIAADIDFAPVARTFASTVFPNSKDARNKFFEETPQAIMSAVLQVFITRAPADWTLRHVVLVMRNMQLIQAITNLEPDARTTMAITFEGKEGSLADVMSTINSKLAPYAEIAASWEGARKRIGIRKWLEDSSILILPKCGPAASETLRFYKLFINVLASNISMLKASRTRRTWIFLDEFTQLGDVEGLKPLILEGRDKGFSCVLGTQQPGPVYEKYGKEEGEALISECGNKALLKATGHAAAEWASESINEYAEKMFEETAEEKAKAEAAFPPRYFMALPKAGFENGLSGVYLNQSVVGWSAHYTPKELRSLIAPPKEHVERFKQIDNESLKLKPWGKEDSELFGIPWPLPSESQEPGQPDSPKTPPAKPSPGEDEDPLGGVDRASF